MQRSIPLLILCCAVLAVLSSGCGRTTTSAPTTPHAVPSTWQSNADAAASIPFWLSNLNDEQLHALVREAWKANPDLVQTAARYQQALARARQSGALRKPTLDATAGATRARTNVDTPLEPQPVYRTEYNVGLGLAWEIDVWDRLGAAARADRADTIAAQADTIAAYRSLAAQIARAWYRLAFEEQRLSLVTRFHTIAATTENFLSQRFADGRTPAVELRAARADLARATADVAERHRAVAEAARTLEQLLGRYPSGTLRAGIALPTPPPPPPAGVPAELLERRPDLHAARERFLASDERLASARADLLPRLSLTANGGTRSPELRDVVDLDYLVWSLIGNLTGPLFDGGRRAGVVDEREARVREASAVWAKTALIALREVEDALAAGELLTQQIAAARTAADEYDAVVEDLRDRYRDGLADGLTLLREQRTALNQRITLLATQLDQLLVRIDLLLALGGNCIPDEADTIKAALTAGAAP